MGAVCRMVVATMIHIILFPDQPEYLRRPEGKNVVGVFHVNLINNGQLVECLIVINLARWLFYEEWKNNIFGTA